MKRHSQHGVALVITLILLSVITFMAVTFLVVSRHEGAAVDNLTQQSNAKFAAEAAFEQAKAQMMANMIAGTNGFTGGLLVSTNFVSTNGFIAGATSITNVNYYDSGGNFLAASVLPQMLNNLLILPRAPVFVVTNKGSPPDFRFFNDMNRNGLYDTNGAIVEHDPNSSPIANVLVTNFYVGDPEWIGVLNHPEARHSASNFFIGRYCFIALPIGNSLDINYIHSHTKQTVLGNDGFFRNEGVGSWEINLAGFLNSLNTNYWGNPFTPYTYNAADLSGNITASPSVGNAFFDAESILDYRYNRTLASLQTVPQMFTNAQSPFAGNYIDVYGLGPMMTNINLPTPQNFGSTMASTVWSGSDTPNQYFTIQDLLNNGGAPFSNRVVLAGKVDPTINSTTNSYNRYTFYRMLSQLSFGSNPESSPYPYNSLLNPNFASVYANMPKMNLNYCNVGGTNTTNFAFWTATNFFMNAADRMLRAYFPNAVPIVSGGVTNFVFLSATNIPIYPVNCYTPAVHRIMQLAANMWDASTNRPFDATTTLGYPTVFAPLFNKTTIGGVTMVVITNYVEDAGTTPIPGNNLYNKPTYSLPEDLASITPGGVFNICGIPWVIGAKQGLPNFNQFSIQTIAFITRKLQLVRLTDNGPLQTNIQYVLSISNQIGLSAWNSYSSHNVLRPVVIEGASRPFMTLSASNDATGVTTLLAQMSPTFTNLSFGGNVIPTNQWAAFNPLATRANQNVNSFQIPLNTNVPLVANVVYHQIPSPSISFTATNFDTGAGNIQPHFLLNMTNHLQFVMVDVRGKVIDYVSLNFNDGSLNCDLTSLLSYPNSGDGGIWDLNRTTNSGVNGPILGVQNQIAVSRGTTNFTAYPPFTIADWSNDQLPPGTSRTSAIANFNNFMLGTSAGSAQAGFSPTKEIVITYTWQANDPLVHYTLGDLTPPARLGVQTNNPASPNTSPAFTNLAILNKQYEPWGNGANVGNANDTSNIVNMLVKDPLIASSDAWQFPTNKFPDVGWIGRVHRGTPWQTIYLKPTATDITNWSRWTGNNIVNPTGIADANYTLPTQDWLLMDLFTTSPNDNASRGQLSINQPNVAAWAAVLDGVVALSNSPTGLIATNIDPNTTSPTPSANVVQYLVNSINTTRAAAPYSGTFSSLGQILSVPQLTTSSPFINTTANTTILRDEVYERIPQQIMSLLRLGTPRYVIFAYGQSLKPANGSIVQSGQYFGMPTNYQVTGEMATRTVMRVENFPTPGTTPNAPRAVIESFNVLPPE